MVSETDIFIIIINTNRDNPTMIFLIFYFIGVHDVKVGATDLRQTVLRKNKSAHLLTVDLHINAVDKEHFHLALIGLVKHALSGES